MIHTHSLTFGYPHTPPLFQDFNWQVSRGEMWAILGSSGCGKTTLLYLLAGLRTPTSGHIQIDGEPLLRPRPRSGLILQDYGLFPWATVRENAELGLRVRGFYGPDGKHTPKNFQAQNDVAHWLERLGLNEVANKYPAQLSGGQRQRTAIACTLAVSPDLLLMDEPFSSLDAITREDLQNLTLSLAEEQKLTLVIVTHAIEEAAALGRKILLLDTASNQHARVFDNPQAGEPITAIHRRITTCAVCCGGRCAMKIELRHCEPRSGEAIPSLRGNCFVGTLALSLRFASGTVVVGGARENAILAMTGGGEI